MATEHPSHSAKFEELKERHINSRSILFEGVSDDGIEKLRAAAKPSSADDFESIFDPGKKEKQPFIIAGQAFYAKIPGADPIEIKPGFPLGEMQLLNGLDPNINFPPGVELETNETPLIFQISEGLGDLGLSNEDICQIITNIITHYTGYTEAAYQALAETTVPFDPPQHESQQLPLEIGDATTGIKTIPQGTEVGPEGGEIYFSNFPSSTFEIRKNGETVATLTAPCFLYKPAGSTTQIVATSTEAFIGQINLGVYSTEKQQTILLHLAKSIHSTTYDANETLAKVRSLPELAPPPPAPTESLPPPPTPLPAPVESQPAETPEPKRFEFRKLLAAVFQTAAEHLERD